jgi:hypothetical protein
LGHKLVPPVPPAAPPVLPLLPAFPLWPPTPPDRREPLLHDPRARTIISGSIFSMRKPHLRRGLCLVGAGRNSIDHGRRHCRRTCAINSTTSGPSVMRRTSLDHRRAWGQHGDHTDKGSTNDELRFARTCNNRSCDLRLDGIGTGAILRGRLGLRFTTHLQAGRESLHGRGWHPS